MRIRSAPSIARYVASLSAAVLCAMTIVQAAQRPDAPPRDTGAPAAADSTRIRGRVTATDTGQPLGRAQVVLAGPLLRPPRRTLTDEEGRYEFPGVPAGSHTVSASKTGYVSLQYGQRRPFESGRPVVLEAGQTVDRIDVALPRGAVIVVRVTDDLGHPIAGVQVRPERFQYRDDGRRTLTTYYGSIPGPSQTDDRGEIRLFGLMPGEYIVSAVAPFAGGPALDPSTASEGYAPTFYPGVTSASQAAPVPVRLGEETTVQFAMVRSRLARVSGVVVDSQGRPANGARVQLATAGPGFSLGVNVGVDGSFAIAGVSPDDYALHVTFDGIDEVAATLTVSDDVSDLLITVSPGTTVSGRVMFEGGPPPVGGASPLRVVLASAARSPAPGIIPSQRTAPIDAEGRFGFTGMTGRIVVDVTPPDGWMMKSVAVDGRDVTNVPIDLGRRATLSNVVVTMTDKVTAVAGAVRGPAAQPLRDYTVVIVPAETYETSVMARRMRVAKPGAEATFSVRGMMPGAYTAVAVEALEQGRQFSPEFQQQVRRLGRAFTLREGETATLDLTLTPDL